MRAALLFIAAIGLVVGGVALVSPAAALIVAGILLGGFTALFVLEV